MNTPWGPSQERRTVAKGIISVSTASHGGCRLSPKRNAQVPAYMRRDDGWYEEDCDWAIPCVVFRAEFLAFAQKHACVIAKTDGTELWRAAKSTLRNWRPEAFEKFFNVVLPPGESLKRDEFIFEMNHRDDFLGSAAYGDWHAQVPEQFVGVYAKRRRPQGEGYFLVPSEEYRGRRGKPFVIDQDRHTVWKDHV